MDKTSIRGDTASTRTDVQVPSSDQAQSADPSGSVGEQRSNGKQTMLEVLRRKLNPALTLENSGSVARDHLAAERTYLAYVRTSLSIASTGVALVQLFSIAGSTNQKLLKYSRPLGATIIIIGLCTLFLGVVRYFSVQTLLLRGMYPVARMGAVLVAIALCAIIIATFVILVASRS